MKEKYYNVISKILQTTSDFLAKETTPCSYPGRGGSIRFEDDLKLKIEKNKPAIISLVNENIPWELVDIDASEHVTEKDKRQIGDCYLLLKDSKGRESKEIINIKITKGNSSDNIGSWKALGYAFHGNKGLSIKGEIEFIQRTKGKKYDNNNHDYFLWSFLKEESWDQIMKSSQTYSFFGTSLDAFRVNNCQSFPIQFSRKNAKPVNEKVPLQKRKEAFFDNFYNNRRKMIELYSSAYDVT